MTREPQLYPLNTRLPRCRRVGHDFAGGLCRSCLRPETPAELERSYEARSWFGDMIITSTARQRALERAHGYQGATGPEELPELLDENDPDLLLDLEVVERVFAEEKRRADVDKQGGNRRDSIPSAE